MKLEEFEEVAYAIENFNDWVFCRCSECKSSAGSHGINEYKSMEVLIEQLRKKFVKED
jgi:hypothetical protein